MTHTQTALRISDRYYGTGDPEVIRREVRLQNWIALAFTVHLLVIVAFMMLREVEKARPVVFHEINVAFEISLPPPPPPPPAPRPEELPQSISLVAGYNPNPGSEAAPGPSHTDTLSLPAVKAPKTMATLTMVPAKPLPSHKSTLAAPIARVTTNEVKTAPLPPKEANLVTQRANVVGPASSRPLSGAVVEAGAPNKLEAGTGTGGIGAEGAGVGAGDPGAGSGAEDAGGRKIATSLPAGAAVAMGNIGPYRRDLLERIVRNWHPKKSLYLVVLVTVNHDGRLVSTEIFQSSGSKKADKEALAAVQMTDYAPLPDWFKGEQLTFRMVLSQDLQGPQQ
jgi:TonB family protein